MARKVRAPRTFDSRNCNFRLKAEATESSSFHRSVEDQTNGSQRGRFLTGPPFFSVAKPLDHHRNEGYGDDADRHQREIVLDDRHVPERVARAQTESHPEHATEHVEQ